jgi:predicted  nucleic acid-binding Zn-ribbon protein
MPKETGSAKSGDEKISLFWRIFGGTILSIVALLVITAYQSITGSIHDMHTELSQLREAKADLVKKDEYAQTRTRIWEKLQDLEKQIGAASAPVVQIKDRVGQLEEQSKTTSLERKEMHELHATIKERMAQFEQQLNQGKTTQKDLQSLLQTVSGLQEKSVLRDQQLKQLEDERKDLMKEVQALRERLARVEATTGAAPKNDNGKQEKPRSGSDTER